VACSFPAIDRAPTFRPSRPGVGTLIALTVLINACGGGDGTTPTGNDDDGQTVVVTVSTSGVDLDADGYTVRLGSRSAPVSPNGSASFEDVPAGNHELRLDGVALNCLVEGSAVRTVSVTGSSGASASFSVDCGMDFGDGLPTVACDALSLQASSALPLTPVAAGRLPAGLTAPLGARLLSDDGSVESVAWFEDDGQGGLEFVTPLHPSGAIEGGPVWIRATDGSAACQPQALTIQALPAAPGEVDRVLDALQAVLRSQTAVLQTTPEALQALAIQDVPRVLLPLWTVQWALDHPGNANSLRALAEGTSGEVIPIELLESLLARSRVLEALNASTSAMYASRSGPPVAMVDANDCTPEAIGNDGPKLAACMGAALELSSEAMGFSEAIGVAIERALPVWELTNLNEGVARAYLATLNWAAVQQELAVWAAMPLGLSGATVVPVPGRFMEDDDRTGSWTLDVEATSMGWDWVVAAFRGTTGAAIQEAIRRAGSTDGELGAGVGAFLGDAVMDFIGDADIQPEVFGPARMDGAEWSEVEYRPASGALLSVDGLDHHTYEPISAGTTLMRVNTPSRVGNQWAFPRQVVETELVVDSIQISVVPSPQFVAPDDRNVPFRITVDNALSPEEIEITVEQGSASAPQGTFGIYDIAYNPPGSIDFSDPDSIHVEYVGRIGPAATGPRRFGFAIVRFGEITILPAPACLNIDDEETFTAEVEGIENQEVVWSAVAGTIDAGGNYQAPSSTPAAGVDTIFATSVEEPDLVGELVVPIGCTCTFTLRLGSEVVTAQPGDRMFFSSTLDASGTGRLSTASVTREVGGQRWHVRMLPDDLNVETHPNGPGTWPVHLQGTLGLTDPTDIIFATDKPPPAWLDLASYEPFDHVRGRVTGSVVVGNTRNEDIELEADWTFAIHGGSACTVGSDP
jgi:hypothetical protein